MNDEKLKNDIIEYGKNNVLPKIKQWERIFYEIYDSLMIETKMLAEYDAKRFRFLNVKLNSEDKDLQNYLMRQLIETRYMLNWGFNFRKVAITLLEFHYIPIYEEIEEKGGVFNDNN